jgi:hypothetical protein
MSNKIYQQIIGTSYEYYVLENIKKDFTAGTILNDTIF